MSSSPTPAPLGRRLLAWLVDALVAALPVSMALVPVVWILIAWQYDSVLYPPWTTKVDEWLTILFWACGLLLSATWLVLYSLYRDGVGSGSLGKRLLGLRVVRLADHPAIGRIDSVTRNLPGLLSVVLFYWALIQLFFAYSVVVFLITLVGFISPLAEPIMILRSPQRQRMGDEDAGTLVVRR